ncbi:hypothetical protein ACB092_02G148800 [Castanea dentata]
MAYFGSLTLSPSTGILLNNKMDDFSIPRNVSADLPPPAPANFISPGKWPFIIFHVYYYSLKGWASAICGRCLWGRHVHC